MAISLVVPPNYWQVTNQLLLDAADLYTDTVDKHSMPKFDSDAGVVAIGGATALLGLALTAAAVIEVRAIALGPDQVVRDLQTIKTATRDLKTYLMDEASPSPAKKEALGRQLAELQKALQGAREASGVNDASAEAYGPYIASLEEQIARTEESLNE